LQVGADLAEKHVRREADRAGEAFADLLAQGALLSGQLARNRHLPLVPIRRHAISSIEQTFSTGRQVSTAVRIASIIGRSR
jgi:hypothetical protein